MRLNHMFNIYHEICPPYMLHHFVKLSDMYNYNTRGNIFNFHIPKIDNVTKHSFFYSAILDWNKLDPEIKRIKTKSKFRQQVKNLLLNRQVL